MKQKSKNIVHQDLLSEADIYTAGLDNAEQQGDFSLVKRVFEQSNAFDFTSGVNKIETPSDVAYIFKKLEDKAIENSFAVLVKNGDPTVLHLGMGTAKTTLVDTVSLISAAEKLKPDQIYFVHNHPSGNLTASPEDMLLYAGIKKILGEKLMSGIIINLCSGKFGMFDDSGNIDEFEHKIRAKKEIPLKLYSFSKQVFDRDYNPEKNFKIKNSSDVAQFICSHRLGERKKMSFLVLQSSHHIVGNILTPYTEITHSNIGKIAKDMVLKAGMLGGIGVIPYGTFSGVDLCSNLMQSIKEKSLGNIHMLDAIYIDREIGMYASWGDNGGFYSKLPADGFEPLPLVAEADMTYKQQEDTKFFTGEKDINGSKIYVGDIIRDLELGYLMGRATNWIAYYDKKLKEFRVMSTIDETDDTRLSCIYADRCVRIGTVQENPELVEIDLSGYDFSAHPILQPKENKETGIVESSKIIKKNSLQQQGKTAVVYNHQNPSSKGRIILTEAEQLALKDGKKIIKLQVENISGVKKDIIIQRKNNGIKIIEKNPQKIVQQQSQPPLQQAKRKL